MRKPAMTPDALPHRGTAAPFRVAIGLVLAASAGMMLWGVGTHRLSLSAPPLTLEDRVAVMMAELAQVKAETAKLRQSQGDTSEELSHIRGSLATAEIGLASLQTTTDENEARRRDTAARIESNLAQLKDMTLRLRMAQDDTATEIGSLRAGVANSEIGIESLRTTTGKIGQQIERIEAVRDATGSIAGGHKHQGPKKWVVQR
jgi:chromosome segregation ATPase